MENKEIKVNIKSEEKKPFFTDDERSDYVKGFIHSYLQGFIHIDFLTAEEFINHTKAQGIYINRRDAIKGEKERKKEFTELINICSGSKPSKPDELKKAISDFYNRIVEFRNSHRFKGTFTKYTIEDRIQKLEEELKITKDELESFIDWYKTGASK